MDFIAKEAGLPQLAGLPQAVEFAVHEKPGKKIIFLLNYTENPQKVTLDRPYQNALTGESEPAEVQIPAFDVKVLTNR